MAKALKVIGVIAGAVALVATGVGVFAVAGSALAGTAASVAAIAGVVAGVANIGASLLTKPPPARGSVTETIIDIEPPSPYAMGEGFFAGVLRHEVGYGATLDKVPNPYWFEAIALSVAGPIAGPITPQIEFAPVSSYYNGFLETDTKLGNRPETALTPPFDPNAPGWSTDHRMSGTAQIGWGFLFDKDGERYASGRPPHGVYAKWALVYDPRKDSTRAGGSGSHRLGDETTYEWSENPALHAGTYAFGRYVNGKRVMGLGLPEEGIDWENISAWANDCDANDWSMYGVVFEPGDRWGNLRDICIAGGAEPLFAGAVLGFHWSRPRIALDTIVEDDLADAAQEVTAMQSWRDRLNTVAPQYLSQDHNWSLTTADPVQGATYLAEDGEERTEQIPFNFVKDVDQAAELAAYWIANSRELTPITLVVKPRLRAYRPGECLALDIPSLGLDIDAVILRRQFDLASATLTLTLVSETAAKHAFALGTSGTAPPTPSIGQTAEERDAVAARNLEPIGFGGVAISGSYTAGLAGQVTQSHNGDGTVDVVIPNHTRVYANNKTKAVTGATLTLADETTFLIYYDDEDRAGGAVTYATTTTAADAYFSENHPDRHFVFRVTTVDAANSGGSTGGSSPPGGGGWSGTDSNEQIP